jgi:hypothetical protein
LWNFSISFLCLLSSIRHLVEMDLMVTSSHELAWYSRDTYSIPLLARPKKCLEGIKSIKRPCKGTSLQCLRTHCRSRLSAIQQTTFRLQLASFLLSPFVNPGAQDINTKCIILMQESWITTLTCRISFLLSDICYIPRSSRL